MLIKLFLIVAVFLPFAMTVDAAVIDEVRKGIGEIREGITGTRTELKDLKKLADGTQKNCDDLDKALKEVQKENAELKQHLDKLRKAKLDGVGQRILRPGAVVSDECAKWLTAYAVQGAEHQGKLAQNPSRQKLLEIAAETFGLEQRAALTTTDVPMPTNFGSEVVELVWNYGQARRFMTVFPLGTLTTKLPKLTTSPAFGLIAQSGAVTEKSPQIAFVTFTAAKSGGIVRIPSEIDADSVVALGQFIARYIAREMAKWEDTWAFMGDGTGTYNSESGVCKLADTLTNKIQLTAGNSNPSTITIANLRALRAKVDAAALGTAAYYLHPTMEAHLASLNNQTNLSPYVPMGPNGPTLDGFPIRWVGVMPIYDTTAHLNQYQVVFGDLSYWYFGLRNDLDVQSSRDVYFATDEIGIRALERFSVQLLANNAAAVLQLAAS
jgi:HK97 family phage major capsid protein